MCFRRCQRGNFYSQRAFDDVDGIIFTPDVLSTMSTRQFLLPTCFRRCRRDNFYSRCAFDAVDGIIFTPDVLSTLSTRQFSLPTCNPITILGFFTLWVWFHRLFRIFEGLSPPSSPPPHVCCRGGAGKEYRCFLRKENAITAHTGIAF